jgi:Uma2 family endonuclease
MASRSSSPGSSWAERREGVSGDRGVPPSAMPPEALHLPREISVEEWAALDDVSPRGGFAFGSELKLKVAPKRGRKPDASAYLPGRLPPVRTASVTRQPPSIVVEVLSPRPRDVRRDMVDKLGDYAAFGVT